MVAILVLAAAYGFAVDLSDTTTVRVRGTQVISAPAGTPTTGLVGGGDLANAATAVLRQKHGRWEYRLTYTPSVTVSALELGFTPQWFQTGSAAIAVHTPSLTVSATGSASYGRLDTSLLYAQLYQAQPAQSPSAQPGQSAGVPTAPLPGQTIELRTLSGDMAATLALGRRSALGLSGGYMVSGGLTTESQRFLPEQYGPHGSLTIRHQLSRVEGLSTTALANEIETSGACAPVAGGPVVPPSNCYGQAYVVQVQETLTRQLSRIATLGLSVGLARSLSLAQDIKERLTVITAAASFSYQFDSGGASRLALSALVAPDVDVRTGLANDRAQVVASLTRQVSADVTVNGSLSASQTIPPTDPYAATVIAASIAANVRVSREFFVSVGEQVFWQNQDVYGSLLSSTTFVGLTVRAPPVRF